MSEVLHITHCFDIWLLDLVALVTLAFFPPKIFPDETKHKKTLLVYGVSSFYYHSIFVKEISLTVLSLHLSSLSAVLYLHRIRFIWGCDVI